LLQAEYRVFKQEAVVPKDSAGYLGDLAAAVE